MGQFRNRSTSYIVGQDGTLWVGRRVLFGQRVYGGSTRDHNYIFTQKFYTIAMDVEGTGLRVLNTRRFAIHQVGICVGRYISQRNCCTCLSNDNIGGNGRVHVHLAQYTCGPVIFTGLFTIRTCGDGNGLIFVVGVYITIVFGNFFVFKVYLFGRGVVLPFFAGPRVYTTSGNSHDGGGYGGCCGGTYPGKGSSF